MSDVLARTHTQDSYYGGLEDTPVFSRVCAPRYHTHMRRRYKILKLLFFFTCYSLFLIDYFFVLYSFVSI
jgi:hypothetical protein